MPVTGVIDDEGQIGALGDPRTQVGPLARSVDDVALLLEVLAGPDGRDGGVAPVPLGDPAAVDLRGLRVAAFGAYDHAEADARRPPCSPTRRRAARGRRDRRGGGAAGGRPRHHDRGLALLRRRARLARALPAAAALGRLAPPCSPRGERYDVLLSPVSAGPAPPHGALAGHDGVDPTSFTTPHSLTGWPAATVRCGSSPEGLPIGMQVVAHPWRDDVALAAALALERASAAGGPRRSEPPPCAILAGVKRFAAVLVAVAAIGAIVAFAAGDSTAATAVAIALIGIAAVGAVSLAFLAVGQAEDRERAEAAAARRPSPSPSRAAARRAADPHPPHARPRPRPPPPAPAAEAGMSRDIDALIAGPDARREGGADRRPRQLGDRRRSSAPGSRASA